MRMIERLEAVAFTCLLTLLISPAAEAQSSEPTPRSLKQGTVLLLQDALPTGHARTDRRIERAIDEVEDSLAFGLWIDGSHLDKATGSEVFDVEKRAIRKLEKIVDDSAAPTDGVHAASAAIADLLAADVLLAEIALDEALASLAVADCTAGGLGDDGDSDSGSDGDSDSDSDSDSGSDSGSDSDSDSDSDLFDCDCETAQRRLARAEEQLVLAMAAIDEGDFEAAVNAFKRAWRKACRAGLAVFECPVVELACPCASPAFPVFSSFASGDALITGCTFDPDTMLMTVDSSAANAEVLILEGENPTCSSTDPDLLIPMVITEEQALECLMLLTLAVEEDLGSTDACGS